MRVGEKYKIPVTFLQKYCVNSPNWLELIKRNLFNDYTEWVLLELPKPFPMTKTLEYQGCELPALKIQSDSVVLVTTLTTPDDIITSMKGDLNGSKKFYYTFVMSREDFKNSQLNIILIKELDNFTTSAHDMYFDPKDFTVCLSRLQEIQNFLKQEYPNILVEFHRYRRKQ